MPTQIHPTAIVHETAQLGEDVFVGPYCLVDEHTVIGDRTRLDAFVHIMPFTRMGADNRVHSHACIGGEPQDLKFHGEKSAVVMGDGNTVREYVTIHRGTEGGGFETRIGNNCLLMAYVHIAHDNILGDGVIMSNAATLAGHVTVGDHVVIGGMSAVHQFGRIGDHAFLGGMTGLTQDLPPFMLAAGSRADLHGPNLIGLRRRNFASDDIRALRNAYRTIWRSGMPRQEALEAVDRESGDRAVIRQLLDFIRSSERGVVTPAQNSTD